MALFGQNMFTLGTDYKLARKLKALDDSEVELLDRTDKIRLMRDSIKEILQNSLVTR